MLICSFLFLYSSPLYEHSQFILCTVGRLFSSWFLAMLSCHGHFCTCLCQVWALTSAGYVVKSGIVDHRLYRYSVLVAQSGLTFRDPIECSPQGSSVHGILQEIILEWVAIPFCRGICPTQGSNLGLLHCRQILYHLSHQVNPYTSIFNFRKYSQTLSQSGYRNLHSHQQFMRDSGSPIFANTWYVNFLHSSWSGANSLWFQLAFCDN